jgi:hypothetical protein
MRLLTNHQIMVPSTPPILTRHWLGNTTPATKGGSLFGELTLAPTTQANLLSLSLPKMTGSSYGLRSLPAIRRTITTACPRFLPLILLSVRQSHFNLRRGELTLASRGLKSGQANLSLPSSELVPAVRLTLIAALIEQAIANCIHFRHLTSANILPIAP